MSWRCLLPTECSPRLCGRKRWATDSAADCANHLLSCEGDGGSAAFEVQAGGQRSEEILTRTVKTANAAGCTVKSTTGARTI